MIVDVYIVVRNEIGFVTSYCGLFARSSRYRVDIVPRFGLKGNRASFQFKAN